MRFLLDQGLPRSTVQHLQDVGLLAEHVGALGLAKATDAAILEEGRKREAIVVTLDSDFHALLAQSNAGSPSVIWIRVEGLKGIDIAQIIRYLIQAVKDDLLAGAAVTVADRRLALRRLPLMSRGSSGPTAP
jgi:predicted nuclease of predicted toxin-antitoxin system